ncbi:Xaa-Pro peptidase family protein [Pararhizobium sp. YC-54]|uniref:M24 family metallopeptidase n=1 Tax=Pararhizobium sp. YC-54 TaxID=2986920 RepID=UPI0021F769A5|nr:Xaa-Pro peptidase family protein [Pararhizobium sp. YC-54]MCW0001571.1 Xaa-Pro peptidase family protein [Pararhizobium sp. YC-54]
MPNMHNDVRKKIQLELQKAGLSAYLAITPANFFYTSGYQSSFLDLSWRMTGTDMVLVPADPSLQPVMIISDFQASDAARATDIDDIRTYSMWIEARDFDVVSGGARTDLRPSRPEQYRHAEIASIVASVFDQWNCSGGLIGTDLDFMQVETQAHLVTACSQAQFVDVADMIYKLRTIKHPEEIRRLRNAAIVFDNMVVRSFEGIKEGYSLEEMRIECELGAIEAVRSNPGFGEYQGSWAFNTIGTGNTNRVKNGDVIKIDAGVRLAGYYSDCARVAIFGEPSKDALLIYEALHRAYDAAADVLKPGNTMRMVHEIAQETVRSRGLPNYSRGHFGHSIGIDNLIEERPFIGANETVFEPGMVVCLELPYYPPSVGSFNIEDMWLITESGAECLNFATRDIHFVS